MARRKNLDTAKKVRKLRSLLGSRRTVVHVMAAASMTSLKRWERRECTPLRAHVRLINETYVMANRMSKALLDKLQRDFERR